MTRLQAVPRHLLACVLLTLVPVFAFAPACRAVSETDWMKAPVSGVANNWVQVARADSGRWVAAVGRETFDVTLKVDLRDGRLLAASMENPVDVRERACAESTLVNCGEAVRYRILRKISVR